MAQATKDLKIRIGTEGAEAATAAIRGLGASMIKLAAIGYAVHEAWKFVKGSIEAAAREETALKRLSSTVENMGKNWNRVGEGLKQFGMKQEEVTRYSHDQTYETLQQIMLLTRDYDSALRLTTLAEDMAASGKWDLATATLVVGKAAVGATQAFARFGISAATVESEMGRFTGTVDKANKYIAFFEKHYGGKAKSDLDTYAGSVDQLKNYWERLQETVGMALLPVLRDLNKYLTDVLANPATAGKIKATADAIVGFAEQAGWVLRLTWFIASGELFDEMAHGYQKKVGLLKDEMNTAVTLPHYGTGFGRAAYDMSQSFAKVAATMDTGTGKIGGNINELTEKMQALGLTTEQEVLQKMRDLEMILASTKDPILILNARKALIGLREEMYTLKTEMEGNGLFGGAQINLLRGENISPYWGYRRPGEGWLGAPSGRQPSRYQRGTRGGGIFSGEQGNEPIGLFDPTRFDLRPTLEKNTDALEKMRNIALSFAASFQGRLTSVFMGIRSLADLTGKTIKGMFQALTDTILQMLAEIAARMVAMGLLKLVGSLIPGLGLLSAGGDIIGGGIKGGGGILRMPGGSRSPSLPAGAPVYHFYFPNIVGVSGDTARQISEEIRKQIRYGQSPLAGARA